MPKILSVTALIAVRICTGFDDLAGLMPMPNLRMKSAAKSGNSALKDRAARPAVVRDRQSAKDAPIPDISKPATQRNTRTWVHLDGKDRFHVTVEENVQAFQFEAKDQPEIFSVQYKERTKVPKSEYKKVKREGFRSNESYLAVGFVGEGIQWKHRFQFLPHSGGPVTGGEFVQHAKTPEITIFPGITRDRMPVPPHRPKFRIALGSDGKEGQMPQNPGEDAGLNQLPGAELEEGTGGGGKAKAAKTGARKEIGGDRGKKKAAGGGKAKKMPAPGKSKAVNAGG